MHDSVHPHPFHLLPLSSSSTPSPTTSLRPTTRLFTNNVPGEYLLPISSLLIPASEPSSPCSSCSVCLPFSRCSLLCNTNRGFQPGPVEMGAGLASASSCKCFCCTGVDFNTSLSCFPVLPFWGQVIALPLKSPENSCYSSVFCNGPTPRACDFNQSHGLDFADLVSISLLAPFHLQNPEHSNVSLFLFSAACFLISISYCLSV